VATATRDSGEAATFDAPMSGTCDVAIIGAGPYGLSAAANLRAVDSLRIAGFGETMSFWEKQMPRGMLLRSPYVACDIGDPHGHYSLPMYERAISAPAESPVPLTHFVDYGRWVQRAVLPDLRGDRVEQISRNGNGFNLRLAGGEKLHADRVVVAAGIADFKHYPEQFRGLSRTLVSHCSEHDDLGVFRGASVLVVGAGQSALESAALLSEAGAAVEIAARASMVNWLSRRWHHNLGLISRMVYAPAEVGPAGISRFVSAPLLFRGLPRRTQNWMTRRSLRPAGSGWLPARLGEVKIQMGVDVTAVSESGGRLSVTFSDGGIREFDHVLLGTGYSVDVARYPFLSPELVQALETVGGFPVLGRGFESSVDGLHFLGAPAAWSFGPLMRFVAGTTFAGNELARAISTRAGASRR
jgi:cation diffusion facilitator CzcD-associated flavoprotein CzcO